MYLFISFVRLLAKLFLVFKYYIERIMLSKVLICDNFSNGLIECKCKSIFIIENTFGKFRLLSYHRLSFRSILHKTENELSVIYISFAVSYLYHSDAGFDILRASCHYKTLDICVVWWNLMFYSVNKTAIKLI